MGLLCPDFPGRAEGLTPQKMKKLIAINITILVLNILASCQPEEAPGPDLSPDVKFIPLLMWAPANSGGGGNTGDDDDEVIQGSVQTSSQQSISNATVWLVNDSTGLVEAIDTTDVNGNFTMTSQTGTYYFEVAASGYPLQQTDSLSITGPVYPLIELQD